MIHFRLLTFVKSLIDLHEFYHVNHFIYYFGFSILSNLMYLSTLKTKNIFKLIFDNVFDRYFQYVHWCDWISSATATNRFDECDDNTLYTKLPVLKN